MKPPLTYFGGKQQLTENILPLIPRHDLYCEPFFGGGALFFAKAPSPTEVINDRINILIDFYRVCQTNFEALAKRNSSNIAQQNFA